MFRIALRWIAVTLAVAVAACSGGRTTPVSAIPLGTAAGPAAQRGGLAVPATIGLGKILTTKDNGQIFGFDVNQNGTDGAFAEATSVDIFDQNTGKITKSFAHSTGQRNTYSFDGIYFGDVGLVTHYITPKGQIYATRKYRTMNPVTAGMFTGNWTPSIADINVNQGAENQTTSTAVLFAIELKNQDKPDLFVSNVAKNTFSNVIHLDPNLFGGADGPQLGQYTAANEGVIALSPDGGRVGGEAPVNVLINLQTGNQTQFTGYNNGPFGAGYVNGVAVDPNTGVEVTTTELNAQVEFYDLNKKTGIADVQLPCTGNASQENSGAGIAVDPINKLFLVTDPFYCNGNQGSALVIYDEKGNLIETITGFKFAIGEGAPAINPSKRMGWAFGPQFSQLQQFFY